MKFRNCDCGNYGFSTTKTVFIDTIVSIEDEKLIDNKCYDSEANLQPDEKYGNLTCLKCNKTYTLNDLIIEE